GRASDRLGCSVVTKKVAIAYAIALMLIAISPTTWTLALALFVFGAAHGAMDVAMNAWAAEVERAGERPLMSSFHAMFSVGAGIGAASGSAAAAIELNFPIHFVLAAVIFTTITLSFTTIPWSSTKMLTENHSESLFVFPRGALFVVGLVAFCASLGEGAMADWSAIFLVSVASVSDAEAALGYVVFSITMVTMRLIGDRIVAWLGPVTAARVGGSVAAVGSLIAVFLATFPMILLGFALMGIGYAVVMPLAFTRAANDKNIPQGAAIASVSTLGYGGILLGPPLIGFVAEVTSLQVAFLIMSVLACVIALLAGILRVEANE
ncbi:MAG: MFS transporter, partial [Pseudomonadales bacterium]